MEKVRAYIEKQHMVAAEDHIIAGISGGADSVCLLFVLLDLRSRLGIPFTAVHVNHGLRGEVADRDEVFVQQLCGEYGVPLEVFRVDLESISKKRKQSLEECGRNIRREAFGQVCANRGGTKIALAHHQNDNAETLLWNLARGTGLAGLGGIRPVNGRYIRPLLCLSRAEIEAFLRQRGQRFCTDDTNQDTGYTRNKLRHLVIPVLEKEVNSQAVRHMNEVAEELREVREYMELRSEEAFHKYVKTNEAANDFLVKNELREEEPDILCAMVLRRALELAAGQTRDIGRVHIRGVLDLFQKQTGRSLNLPCAMRAVRTYEGIELGQDREAAVPCPPFGSPHAVPGSGPEPSVFSRELRARKGGYPLRIPGETRIPEMGLTVFCRVFPKTMCFSMKEIPQKVYTKWFDYDIIEIPPCIRSRQGGDQIAIDRAGHRQKLKSWFINEKIPARERDAVPCIASGNEILWIPGYRMSSAYQIRSDTKQILQIEVVKEDGKAKELG